MTTNNRPMDKTACEDGIPQLFRHEPSGRDSGSTCFHNTSLRMMTKITYTQSRIWHRHTMVEQIQKIFKCHIVYRLSRLTNKQCHHKKQNTNDDGHIWVKHRHRLIPIHSHRNGDIADARSSRRTRLATLRPKWFAHDTMYFPFSFLFSFCLGRCGMVYIWLRPQAACSSTSPLAYAIPISSDVVQSAP